VFEDSLAGLEAGRRSGAKVVGVATTNSREKISDKADFIVDNTADFSL
jgi:beta-phosphoglucomutase-like phosphatase (HAD superfamily)